MENSDKIYVEDPVYSKMNKITGEIEELRIGIKKHVQDFFCMYLEAWDDFTDREGGLKTVFTWCIMQSKYSVAGGQFDGNIFFVAELLNYVKNKMPDRDLNSIRNIVSRLAKRGFIIKHEDIRGCYYINPKYGIKGNISESMFVELTMKASFGRDNITTNVI